MARDEVQDRVKDVVSWILEGHSYDDIEQALNQDGVDKAVIRDAYARIEKSFPDESARVSWHLESRRELYRKTMAISDYKAAHAILVDMAKLENLYQAQREAKPETHDQPWPHLKAI